MNIQNYIDHTVLSPNATESQVSELCDEAIKFQFASVCVNPYYASFVSKALKGSEVKTCIVIGFPLGANTKEVKAFETEDAIVNGAQEIDMVINIGALKDKKYDIVLDDIKAVVKTASKKALVKVIIESCLLTDDEKKKACELSVIAGAEYVKTSTGFSTGGATAEDVKLMKSVVNEKAKVKASGGVRDLETLEKMVLAGAERIGTSSGIKILSERNKC
jgi:deoxyribose-phosphate aldolase